MVFFSPPSASPDPSMSRQNWSSQRPLQSTILHPNIKDHKPIPETNFSPVAISPHYQSVNIQVSNFCKVLCYNEADHKAIGSIFQDFRFIGIKASFVRLCEREEKGPMLHLVSLSPGMSHTVALEDTISGIRQPSLISSGFLEYNCWEEPIRTWRVEKLNI